MAATPSRFVWYELMTSDPAAARAFYTQVVGWQATDSGMPGMDCPSDSGPLFDPGSDKAYRHPQFYKVPRGVRGV